MGPPGAAHADDLECLFRGLDRPEDGLLNPEQRESQLILGELEYFLAPLVLKLAPCLEQLTQLRIIRRDLTRELPPGLEVVATSGRVAACPVALLLCCLEVRVGAARVVGDVDDPGDLGRRPRDGDLDPLR